MNHITILRSSDLRGRPSSNRPRYQTCEWMDPLCMNVWTQCWGARFISSNQKPSIGRLPILSPMAVGGARSPATRVACAREWTSGVCVRAWLECARLDENACREETNENNILKSNKIEKHIRRKIQEILLSEVADPRFLERRNFGNDKNSVITRISFVLF